MTSKIKGLIFTSTMALLFAGCNGMENSNMANANHNANANVANQNVNANANANTNSNTNPATRRAPSREEYERDKERYQREAKDTGRTIGTGLNDGWLWVKTRFDLAAADDLRDSTINVDVDNAVVTLTGTVATPAQRTRAEQVVKAIEEVKIVKIC